MGLASWFCVTEVAGAAPWVCGLRRRSVRFRRVRDSACSGLHRVLWLRGFRQCGASSAVLGVVAELNVACFFLERCACRRGMQMQLRALPPSNNALVPTARSLSRLGSRACGAAAAQR